MVTPTPAEAQIFSEASVLTDLGAFIARFRTIREQGQEVPVRLKQFLDGFQEVLPRLKKDEERWERVTAPRFNVFRVLQLERKETKLHSRFIGELLDPCGSHGQGITLLKAFFSANDKIIRPASWGQRNDWKVSLEEAALDGDRFDIVLRGPSFIAVIENKIDALEQPKQLERYHKWLYQQDCPARMLMFLTIEGREPKTLLKEHREFFVCLSYKEHIQRWLQNAITEGIAPIFRDALKQYLQVVINL